MSQVVTEMSYLFGGLIIAGGVALIGRFFLFLKNGRPS